MMAYLSFSFSPPFSDALQRKNEETSSFFFFPFPLRFPDLRGRNDALFLFFFRGAETRGNAASLPPLFGLSGWCGRKTLAAPFFFLFPLHQRRHPPFPFLELLLARLREQAFSSFFLSQDIICFSVNPLSFSLLSLQEILLLEGGSGAGRVALPSSFLPRRTRFRLPLLLPFRVSLSGCRPTGSAGKFFLLFPPRQGCDLLFQLPPFRLEQAATSGGQGRVAPFFFPLFPNLARPAESLFHSPPPPPPLS